jgi:ABC-type uncharacterized transport system involved in gliding motility auxiliary subunit
MSTPEQTSAPKNRGWLLTAVGTLVVLAITVVVNIIASLSSSRVDWTEYEVHTLTEGTKNIVGRVDTDTTLKFFVSPKDQLPPNLRPLVDQTDSWLARYRELNPKFVKIEKQEVEPATDEEEAAKAAGIEPRGGRFYFGVAVTSLDKSALIDWVPDLLSSDGKEDDKIEYNLSRAISEVNRSKQKTLGLLTPLQITGNPFGGAQPWAIYQALKSQYDAVGWWRSLIRRALRRRRRAVRSRGCRQAWHLGRLSRLPISASCWGRGVIRWIRRTLWRILLMG